MNGMRGLNAVTSSQPQLSGKRCCSSVLEIDSWMPSKIQAISPTVDRLMRLIEGSQCIPGNEFDVELALREALGNAVVHGNQEDPEKKVHIRCRCGPGKAISIIVTDQGKGFDFGKALANGVTADPAAPHGRRIPLIDPYMHLAHFILGASQPPLPN